MWGVSSPFAEAPPLPFKPRPLINIPHPPGGGTRGVPRGGWGEALKGPTPLYGGGGRGNFCSNDVTRGRSLVTPPPTPKGTHGGVGEGMGEPLAALEETPPLPPLTSRSTAAFPAGAGPPLPSPPPSITVPGPDWAPVPALGPGGMRPQRGTWGRWPFKGCFWGVLAL